MPDQTTSTSSAVGTKTVSGTTSASQPGTAVSSGFHDDLQEHFELSQLSKLSEAQQTRFAELQSNLGPRIDPLEGTPSTKS